MAKGLDTHAVDDGLAQRRFIAGKLAQDGQQVHGVVLTEARVKLAFGGDADAIAGVAEVMAVRGDEADT